MMPVIQPPDSLPDPVVDVAQLRAGLTAALDWVERKFGPAIALSDVPLAHDEYWQLPVQTAYALDDDPGLRFMAGSLRHDLDGLGHLLVDPGDEVLGLALENLAGVLRFLAFADMPRRRRYRREGVGDADVAFVLGGWPGDMKSDPRK